MHQRILVAGYSHDPSTNSDVAVVPYTEDGARDMTFGAGAVTPLEAARAPTSP